MAGVYQQIEKPNDSQLWLLYMRMYELLWRLPPQTIALGEIKPRLNQDAQLGARLVRSYARDWLGGGGRFACLCFPYVEQDKQAAEKAFKSWCDATKAGPVAFPMACAKRKKMNRVVCYIRPKIPILSGLGDIDISEGGLGRVRGKDSGVKTIKTGRSPFEYSEILQASGVELSLREITARYYKERALPHLIPFPTRLTKQARDPLPEAWRVGRSRNRSSK